MLEKKLCRKCGCLSERFFKWRWHKKKEEFWLAIFCKSCGKCQKKANQREAADPDVPDQPEPRFQSKFQF